MNRTIVYSLTVFAPALIAQEYCVSGAITAVQFCSNCGLENATPVEVTYDVQAGTVACPISTSCSANGTLKAQVGTQQYLNQGLSFNTMSINVLSSPSLGTTSTVVISGQTSQSTAGAANPTLTVSFDLISSTNLLSSGGFPSSIPLPSQSQLMLFTVSNGAGVAYVSYTGQNCVGGSGGSTPVVTSVLNDASFATGGAITPGAWLAIFGTSLAPAGDSRLWNPATEIVNGKLPSSLDGTSVTIDGKAASVEYISPTR